MSKKVLKKVSFMVLIFLLNISYSQITVDNANANATQLTTKINGAGFTISGEKITIGDGLSQSGVFSNGIAGTKAGAVEALSIDSGIFLTTGSTSNVTNTSKDLDVSGSATLRSNVKHPVIPTPDSDLIGLDPAAKHDQVVYEFDFVINGSEPKIFALDYQFASEEYPDFVCSDKNDVFGFFISGGDLPGTANLASVGGNDTAVNFINGGKSGLSAVKAPCDLTRSSSFVKNYKESGGFYDPILDGDHTLIYNGLTKVLRAYTILRPGISYHMKMAISDVDDRRYDSGVFVAPIQIKPLPAKSDIDFDGIDDYVNTKGVLGDFTGTTMMSWVKLDAGSKEQFICGQENYNISVGTDDKIKVLAQTGDIYYDYKLEVEDFTPADGMNGYFQVFINGGAALSLVTDPTAFTLDQLATKFGDAKTTYSFSAAVGDVVTVKYFRNGAAGDPSLNEGFKLIREDAAVAFSNGSGVSMADNQTWVENPVSCATCDPIVEKTVVGPKMSIGEWCHVTSVFNGSELKLYVNGEFISKETALGSKLSKDGDLFGFNLGKNTKGAVNHLDGSLDDVRVYNIALTDRQIQEQVYQEIENVGGKVFGATIPKAIGDSASPIDWSALRLYFNLDLIADVTLVDNSAYLKNGYLNNITSVLDQTAPMPYVANATGNWTVTGTWQHGNVWDIENLPNKNWTIVQVANNSKVTTTASHTHLGTLVDSGSEFSIENDQLLTTTSYLKLDGHLDLVGESQLIQTVGSTFEAASTGYLERDQQGKSTIYSYNFWSSPVYPTADGVNNADYSITEILKSDILSSDTSKNIKFIAAGYDGATVGTTVTLADYWMFKFVNQPDVYGNWFSGHVRSTGDIKVGEGYTMKGAGAVTQNYVFTGKPNNGVIQHNIGSNHVYLMGNPYSSALDANKFINDNIASVENQGNIIGNGTTRGALYFWEHFTGNSSHIFAEYQGGYATYNLVGGVMANPDVDVSSNGTGTIRPGQYVPVGQGFFIEGSPSGGLVEFNNSQRVFKKEVASSPGAGVDYSIFAKTAAPEGVSQSELGINEETSVSDVQRVYFKFTRPEGSQRELLLGVKSGLADGPNFGYDARLLENLSSDCGWLLKTAEGDEKLVIQGIGAIYNDLELPLHIKASKDGVCTFEAESFADLEPSVEVYFLDKELGTRVRLEAGVATEFNLAAGIYSDRFYVVFKQAEILSVEDNTVVADDLVVFYNGNTKNIEISNPTEFTAKNITLYAVTGQQITRVNNVFTGVSKVEVPVNVASGTYLVRFDYNDSKQITKKLIIK